MGHCYSQNLNFGNIFFFLRMNCIFYIANFLTHTKIISNALRIGFISFKLSSLDKGCCRFERLMKCHGLYRVIEAADWLSAKYLTVNETQRNR